VIPVPRSMLVRLGVLIPEHFLESGVFQFLSASVALNTIMYVALAIAKMLPKLYLSDWVRRYGRRTEIRGIHPDDPIRG
jgi:hypothetical protein